MHPLKTEPSTKPRSAMNMPFSTKSLTILMGLALLLSACSKRPHRPFYTPDKRPSHAPSKEDHSKHSKRYRVPYDNGEKVPQTELREVASKLRKRLQTYSREVIGNKGSFVLKGKTHKADCSGMVRGVYEAAGVDLFDHTKQFDDAQGGVDIIFRSFKKAGWKGKKRLPQAGDLIFFSNTWDKNGNGRWDDPLTHVGIVEGVEEGSNTVSFIHSVSRGIRRYRINLDHNDHYMKDGRKMNDFLRRRPDSDPDRTKYLSSNLFVGYIDVISALGGR